MHLPHFAGQLPQVRLALIAPPATVYASQRQVASPAEGIQGVLVNLVPLEDLWVGGWVGGPGAERWSSNVDRNSHASRTLYICCPASFSPYGAHSAPGPNPNTLLARRICTSSQQAFARHSSFAGSAKPLASSKPSTHSTPKPHRRAQRCHSPRRARASIPGARTTKLGSRSASPRHTSRTQPLIIQLALLAHNSPSQPT